MDDDGYKLKQMNAATTLSEPIDEGGMLVLLQRQTIYGEDNLYSLLFCELLIILLTAMLAWLLVN